MFKPLRLGLLLISVLTLPNLLSAQQTRVAYIDAGKLLKRMPEAIDAATRLDQLTATWAKEAGDMQNELDRKQAEFERRKLIMTDAERSASEVELQNLRKKLDDYRHQKFDATGGELFSQQATMMKPAYERLQNAIKEAAGDGNFDYVIDRSSKDIVLLYTNAKFDLTIPVARKLGIESEILTTPLINNGPKGGTTPPGGTPPAPPPPGTLPPAGSQPMQQPPPGGLQPGQQPPTPGINPIQPVVPPGGKK